MRVPVAPYPDPTLELTDVPIADILERMPCYLILFLICISLISSDAEFFMCLLPGVLAFFLTKLIEFLYKL